MSVDKHKRQCTDVRCAAHTNGQLNTELSPHKKQVRFSVHVLSRVSSATSLVAYGIEFLISDDILRLLCLSCIALCSGESHTRTARCIPQHDDQVHVRSDSHGRCDLLYGHGSRGSIACSIGADKEVRLIGARVGAAIDAEVVPVGAVKAEQDLDKP